MRIGILCHVKKIKLSNEIDLINGPKRCHKFFIKKKKNIDVPKTLTVSIAITVRIKISILLLIVGLLKKINKELIEKKVVR